MTKKKPIEDPEWNPLARAGEIISQLSQLGEKIKTLVSELEAKAELARRQEFKVLKRGVLEIGTMSESVIARFQDVPTVEINGKGIPPRPGQMRGVGRNAYEAVTALALELKQEGIL